MILDKFKTPPTADESKDTGMALAFLALLIGVVTDSRLWLYAALVLLLVDMLFPRLFKHAARVWFGLAHVLGLIASTIILSAVYYLVITPTGLVRRLMGRDSMRVSQWKHGTDSVFEHSEHVYSADDIGHPY